MIWWLLLLFGLLLLFIFLWWYAVKVVEEYDVDDNSPTISEELEVLDELFKKD